MPILSGKEPAKFIKTTIHKTLTHGDVLTPTLVIYQVGDKEASNRYVRNKIKDCEEVGIKAILRKLPEDILRNDLLAMIASDNIDPSIHGIIVQLPLPNHLNEREILDSIIETKDVDGLSTMSIGRLHSDQPGFRPCTPMGVITLLQYYQVPLDGKTVAIVGRSNLVGKPLEAMFTAENATVTMFHSHSKNVKEQLKNFDIIVLATGRGHWLHQSDLVYDGVAKHHWVIDVTIAFDENGKMIGEYYNDNEVPSDFIHYTPVPGGVGLMTRATLLDNTLNAAIRQVLYKEVKSTAWRQSPELVLYNNSLEPINQELRGLKSNINS